MEVPARLQPIGFDRVSGEYDASRGGVDRARISARDLAEHLVPGDVLELGVGTGIVAEALLEETQQVRRFVGVDISRGMLAQARRRLPGRLLRASAQRLPFAAGTFDTVVAVHVLHLVTDLGQTLREAARVLRPTGRIVAVHGESQVDPPEEELAAAMRALRALRARRDDSPAVLREAAEAAGLRCLAQHPSSVRITRHTPAELAALIERNRTTTAIRSIDELTVRVGRSGRRHVRH